jgi:hypothetical protein
LQYGPARPPTQRSHLAPVKRSSQLHVKFPGAHVPWRLQSQNDPQPVSGQTYPALHTQAPVPFAPLSQRPCPLHVGCAHRALQSDRPYPASHTHVLVADTQVPWLLHGVEEPPGHVTLQKRPDQPGAHSHEPSPDLPSTQVLWAGSQRHRWSQLAPYCPASGHDWQRFATESKTTSQNLPQ